MEFIISDFSEKKEANKVWYSSPFYTHNRGYKFRLKVYPNGDGTASGSHITVGAALIRGECDNELEWPFEGDIRVELLNWRADKNHHSDTFPSTDTIILMAHTLLVSLTERLQLILAFFNSYLTLTWCPPLTQNTCVTTTSN